MSYSVDLRERVVKFVMKGNSRRQASNLFEVHYNTVKSWVRIYQAEGRITPSQSAGLKPYKLDREALTREVQEPPELFQSEQAQTFGVVQSTISKAFQQLGITRKKINYSAEANEEQKQNFRQAVKTLTEEPGVYLDEGGINPHLNREFGWAPRHDKVLGKIPGKRESKLNLIAALHSSELKAPLSYQGTMNTTLFNTYLKELLLPLLMPGQVVIMDNATFHKSLDTHRLITEKPCQVWYLPPYSPELNPIEHTWAVLKRYVRRYRVSCQSQGRISA
ncbi:transposase [Thioploca ingrica]|uniref:Transposase n=1 Tax=Thioploca ingrica TaxID=40754 RepID=A0A090AFP8_9GAMM|nr:transposase [Thioploca ingrica]